MKYVLWLLFFSVLGGIAVGYYIKNTDNDVMGDRIIGLSVLAMAFVLMPLFIYHRYRNKKMEDFQLIPKQKR